MLKFTLKLYNNPLLSRKAVDEIITTFDDFLSNLFIPFVQEEIKTNLSHLQHEESIHQVQFILENSKHFFNHYSTEHFRFKFYQEESFFIPPESFEIGEEAVHDNRNPQKVDIKIKKVYGAHVPLQKTLETFFSIPGIFEQMHEYYKELSTEKNVLSNFVQGDLWSKNYCTQNEDELVFPLVVYFDEFQTGNPLGSHALEQKFGGFYASLPCLPPHLVAKLENVFLLSIFYSKHLQQFGNEKVFSKAIEDLNFVSKEGIKITVNGKDLQVYFHCVMVLGDNLGVNTICGFSKGFNAAHYCRFCTAPFKTCQEMLIENKKLMRTVDSYETDLLKNDFKATGIVEKCIFNKMNKFNIMENMSVDIAHDCDEGVAVYTIGGILEHLIKAKIISLDKLNNRIETFPYSDLEKSNKPRPLFFSADNTGRSKLKIKQSASEMLCLVRYLGLMIGDLIPPNNMHWKLYILLRKLIGILTSPRLTRGEIVNLREIIQKHNALYIHLFGSLKPKMHFLLHYPTIMLLNGPVIHYSTLMFERKNKALKEMSLCTTSNINLPHTIAVRHQLQQCYNKEFCQNFKSDLILGPVKNVNEVLQTKRLITDIPENTIVTSLKYIEIIGKHFSEGTVLVTKIAEDNPMFGIIKNIFMWNTNIFFQIKEFDTLYFDHYYHSYQVKSNESNCDIISNVNLIPKLPPCLYIRKNSNEYIATRFDI